VGETNIEFMKRHLGKMEDRIKKQLDNCKRARKLHRSRRRRQNLRTVGIIGYTNAGKSSLLNALTGKGAYEADKLFATLDTRVGKIYFRETGKEILISDTIGFIQDLPPQLIKSFNSTLEETIEADLLLHVIDISDPRMENKISTVNEILAQMQVLTKPTIYVFNKTDLKSSAPRSRLSKKYKACEPCFVSSKTGEGIGELKERIQDNL
jgi:GTP-binding protein HflX